MINYLNKVLIDAVKRGVTVEVIVPGPYIDHDIVQYASQSQWEELLKAGVKIYEYQPAMYHCKLFIVDDNWVSVGSTNFDNRSFRLNSEANLNILDREFALEQIKIFEADKARSKPVSHRKWIKRAWLDKLRDILSGIFKSQF